MANERKLIDADALIKSMREEDLLYPGVPWSTTGVQKQIDKLPTVDAVKVVRCKDCAKWGGVPFGNVCRRWSAPLAGMKNCTGPDDYCSYGERRADEGRNGSV